MGLEKAFPRPFSCDPGPGGISQSHFDGLVSHKLLQGRFANSVIEERDGKSVPEAVRGQSIDPQFTAQITNNGADVRAAVPGSAVVCEEIIVGAFPSVFLPGLQNGQTLRSEGNNAVFETLPFPDVELPLVLDLDDIVDLQSGQFCRTNAGME